RRFRPSLAWEQALPLIYRRHRLDAFLTWSERLPLVDGGRYLVWLFEPPTHRIETNRAVAAGVYQRAADVATRLVWKRSVRRAGGFVGPRQDRVEYLGRVSDDELVQLYRGAAAYVDTSRYEGFGYQVLEAMACGAPVIATGGTSIPEIVGDAGIVCAPDELAAQLARVLSDPNLAE